MSFSYSGLTSYGKSSLPNVSLWQNNHQIKRDPPRSIHTRKIEKVGNDQSLTMMIDESGDRVSEMINVYARGTNPHISVSYNNSGGNQQAKLPYRVMRDGAFRPAVDRIVNDFALSRIPRSNTHVEGRKQHIIHTLRILDGCNKKLVLPDVLHTESTSMRSFPEYNVAMEPETVRAHLYENKMGKRGPLQLKVDEISGKTYVYKYTPMEKSIQKTGITEILHKGEIKGQKGFPISSSAQPLTIGGVLEKVINANILKNARVENNKQMPYSTDSKSREGVRELVQSRIKEKLNVQDISAGQHGSGVQKFNHSTSMNKDRSRMILKASVPNEFSKGFSGVTMHSQPEYVKELTRNQPLLSVESGINTERFDRLERKNHAKVKTNDTSMRHEMNPTGGFFG